MAIHCTFCSKSAAHCGVIVPAPKPGVYICDECAILVVFGAVMQKNKGGIPLLFPDGEHTVLKPLGESFLGTEYCPQCGVYAVELGKPVDAHCMSCGALYPLRNADGTV